MGEIQDLKSVFGEQSDLIKGSTTTAVAGDGAMSVSSLRFGEHVGTRVRNKAKTHLTEHPQPQHDRRGPPAGCSIRISRP